MTGQRSDTKAESETGQAKALDARVDDPTGLQRRYIKHVRRQRRKQQTLHPFSGLQVGKTSLWCPRQDSNLRFYLRRVALYPLSYGGLAARPTTRRGGRLDVQNRSSRTPDH